MHLPAQFGEVFSTGSRLTFNLTCWNELRCEWLPGVDPLLDWEGRRPGPIAQFDSNYWRPWWHPKHKPTFNQLLQAQARILDWIAAAVPNLDEVILQHVQTHSQFNTVFDMIERKLAPNLRIEELARAYGTTLHAFSMAFARNTGMSPKAYLKRRLNQEAMQLLLNSDLKIKEVASHLRFSDEFHFSRFFRIANGLAPLQYRRAFHCRSSTVAQGAAGTDTIVAIEATPS